LVSTSIFSIELAGIVFNASIFESEDVLPLINTVGVSKPLNVIPPLELTEINGILFKISVAIPPAAEKSFPHCKLIYLL